MGPAEFEYVREAFATNWIAPLGPHVDGFEREFAERISAPLSVNGDSLSGTPTDGRHPSDEQRVTNNSVHAAALSSGTAALHLAMRLVGVKADDEVFVSTLTFSASVNPILYERGRPVFIDSERASWNMDPALLEKALADRKQKGKLPRAVVLVHLYGQCADIDPIAALCEKYGVALIEDAAEALGAVYYGREKAQKAQNSAYQTGGQPELSALNSQLSTATTCLGVSPGTRGRLGIYSFNGNKIITTSSGGMLVSADATLIEKARFMATQARDPAPHYQHSEVGFNYRMSNVLAGIGRGQLQVLADRVNARRANCAFYEKAFADLPGISFMPEAPWNRCTRWLTCILVDPAKFGADQEKIRLAMGAENIEARPVWKPMHLQPVFAGYDRFGGEVAEDLFERGLCLPSGSNLAESDLQRVVDVVRSVARR